MAVMTIREAINATLHAAPVRCGMAADIAALVSSQAFSSLKSPVQLVTAPHSPVPFARELERAYLVSPEKIGAAVRNALAYRHAK